MFFSIINIWLRCYKSIIKVRFFPETCMLINITTNFSYLRFWSYYTSFRNDNVTIISKENSFQRTLSVKIGQKMIYCCIILKNHLSILCVLCIQKTSLLFFKKKLHRTCYKFSFQFCNEHMTVFWFSQENFIYLIQVSLQF